MWQILVSQMLAFHPLSRLPVSPWDVLNSGEINRNRPRLISLLPLQHPNNLAIPMTLCR